MLLFADNLSPAAASLRHLLRADVPSLVLGLLFLFVGLAAAGLFWLRTGRRDPALFWLGCLVGLYGIQLIVLTPTLAFVSGVSAGSWQYVAAVITYVIPLPGLRFLETLFPLWRVRLRQLLAAQALFAVAGIVSDEMQGRPESLGSVNNVFVLLQTIALGVALFRFVQPTAEVLAVRRGLLVFCGTVTISNLADLKLLSWHLSFLEPFGFAVFLSALGRMAVRRAWQNEERLVALDQELETARRIQASILPHSMPALSGVQVEARYQPMTAVAGDFYDFLVQDKQQVGVLIADVSGHGVPAALIASMVKVAGAAQQAHADDPAAVLAGMNRTLTGNLQGQFVTAAYLYLDLAAQRLRYSAAGHPPVLWKRALRGNAVEEMIENGLALGMAAEAEYGCVEHSFAAGDQFLLYTDGLVEARNAAHEMFGDERLQQALAAHSSLASIWDAAAAWAGSELPEDDWTALLITVNTL